MRKVYVLLAVLCVATAATFAYTSRVHAANQHRRLTNLESWYCGYYESVYKAPWQKVEQGVRDGSIQVPPDFTHQTLLDYQRQKYHPDSSTTAASVTPPSTDTTEIISTVRDLITAWGAGRHASAASYLAGTLADDYRGNPNAVIVNEQTTWISGSIPKIQVENSTAVRSGDSGSVNYRFYDGDSRVTTNRIFLCKLRQIAGKWLITEIKQTN